MLSLLDPVEFESTVIFRDDADARKFYLLPDQPQIPLDDKGNPEFLLITFSKVDQTTASNDLGGGLLQFRSVLTMDPDRRKRIVDALTARLQTDQAAGVKPLGNAITSTEPLLADPLWTDGKVTLSTFKVGDTDLVRAATSEVPVDLTGNLGASATLQLDPDGAGIFAGAFKSTDDQKIPIMLTYQLKYKARVSANMTIHAERDVIHQRVVDQARPYQWSRGMFVPLNLPGPFNLRLPPNPMIRWFIPRLEIPKIIDKTVTDNAVKVVITDNDGVAVPNGTPVADAMFKMATDVLVGRVLPAIFGEDAGKPGAANPGDTRPTVDLMEVKPDAAGPMNFDLAFDYQSATERQINPNGPVQLAISDPQVRDHCFQALRLDDSNFFSVASVTATTAGVNFKDDGIEAILVHFEYSQTDDGDSHKPLVARSLDGVLKSESEAVHWRFDLAREANGGYKKDYRYKTQVTYREGPPSNSDWTTSKDEQLILTPRAMGALRVECVLTAPETLVDSARVQLQYRSQGGNTYQTALELSQKDPRESWLQYTGDLAAGDDDLNPPAYTYTVTYRLKGSELSVGPLRSTAKLLEIASPFNKTLSFTLRPQGSFDGVRDLSGDLTYNDAAHGYATTQSFQLANLSASAVLGIPVFDDGPQTAHVRVRMNRADGTSTDLGTTEVQPGTVFVGRQPAKVDVLADLVDFDTQFKLVVAQMTYNDPANGVSEHRTFTFTKAVKGPQSWIFNRVAGGSDLFDADVQFYAYDSARNVKQHFRQVSGDVFLLDPTAQP